MRVSVVINACRQTTGLRQTLLGLRPQSYRHFEVIVITGPAYDGPELIPAPFAAAVRTGRCADANPSRARNAGIALASGELVAFLEVGAVPEPRWLEGLVAAFDSDDIGGTGGLVYGAAGPVPQSPGSACLCDRLGKPDPDARPPFWGNTLRYADPFAQLSVSNACFRRRSLEEVGGFDEDLDEFLEGADLCLRLIDRGHRLRPLGAAAVYHPAPDRPSAETAPVSWLKDRAYFALRWHPPETPADAITQEHVRHADQLLAAARARHAAGALTAEELAAFEEELDRALWLGIARGCHGRGKYAALPPARPDQFRPFPTLAPQPHPLTLCLVGDEPQPEGGAAGRPLWELARGLAACGHEIHFLARAVEAPRVAFEEGVWVHQVAPAADGPGWSIPGLLPPAKADLAHADAVYREVARLRRARLVDLVCVSLGGAAGLYCLLDNDLVCSLLLPPGGGQAGPEQAQRRTLEQLALRSARAVHAVGQSALDQVCTAYGPPAAAADVFVTAGAEAAEALAVFGEVIRRRRFPEGQASLSPPGDVRTPTRAA